MIDNINRPIFQGSRWNGAASPIVYEFELLRREWDTVSPDGDTIQLSFFANFTYTAYFAVGDYVLVQSQNSELYNDLGRVTEISSAPAGGGFSITTLKVDIPSKGSENDIDTINYIQPDWRLSVHLYDLDDVRLTEAPFEYYPILKQGTVKVDVASIIKSFLSPENALDYRDVTASIGFYIGYEILYTDSVESEVLDSAQPIFAVLGALAIPSATGGNYRDYLALPSETRTFKLLTKLTRPKYWRGFPWSISAIFGEVIDDFSFTFDSEETTVTNDQGHIYQGSPDPNDIGVATSFTAKATYAANDSEVLTIDVVDPCNNPVMLLGRNSLGGALWWLFDYSQDEVFEYRSGKKALRKTLYAQNLSKNEWEALHDFFGVGEVYSETILEFDSDLIATSRKVGQQVYEVKPNGDRIGVIVIPTQNKTRTKQVTHLFQLTIEYPESFNT